MVNYGEPTDLGTAVFTGFIAAGLSFASGIIVLLGKWIVSTTYNRPVSGVAIPVAGVDQTYDQYRQGFFKKKLIFQKN